MHDRVGQTWAGLFVTEPARLLLVVRLLADQEHHYGYRYRTYACLDLESGDVVERSESERAPWDDRACTRVA